MFGHFKFKVPLSWLHPWVHLCRIFSAIFKAELSRLNHLSLCGSLETRRWSLLGSLVGGPLEVRSKFRMRGECLPGISAILKDFLDFSLVFYYLTVIDWLLREVLLIQRLRAILMFPCLHRGHRWNSSQGQMVGVRDWVGMLRGRSCQSLWL